MKSTPDASEIIRDLWNFIENADESDPQRTDEFFGLRERVRNYYADEARRSKRLKRS